MTYVFEYHLLPTEMSGRQFPISRVRIIEAESMSDAMSKFDRLVAPGSDCVKITIIEAGIDAIAESRLSVDELETEIRRRESSEAAGAAAGGGITDMTIDECATVLGVAPRVAKRWFDARRLKGYVDEKKGRMVPIELLVDFIGSRKRNENGGI